MYFISRVRKVCISIGFGGNNPVAKTHSAEFLKQPKGGITEKSLIL